MANRLGIAGEPEFGSIGKTKEKRPATRRFVSLKSLMWKKKMFKIPNEIKWVYSLVWSHWRMLCGHNQTHNLVKMWINPALLPACYFTCIADLSGSICHNLNAIPYIQSDRQTNAIAYRNTFDIIWCFDGFCFHSRFIQNHSKDRRTSAAFHSLGLWILEDHPQCWDIRCRNLTNIC